MSKSTEEAIWWNLTAKMAPFLDQHQLLHLIEFQSDRVEEPIFKIEDLNKQKLNVLKTLDMVDYTWEWECKLKGIPEDTAMPDALQQRREEVINSLTQVESEYEDVQQKLVNPEVQAQLKNDRDNRMLWDLLKERYGFLDSDLDTIFERAMKKYAVGDYEETSDTLYIFAQLAPYEHPKHLSAIWGKLASEIFQEAYDSALEDVNHLKESIDKANANKDPLSLLQWRTWLLHWSLFVFFTESSKNPKGGCSKTNEIVTLFLNTEEYRNAIETICPWLLRYIAVVIVTAKNLDQKNYKQVIRIIEQEHYNYSDPITDFLLCLNVRYDFDEAQLKLMQAEKVLKTDYFLHDYATEFIEQGRVLMFEMYCKIHQKISISTIAEKLSMTQEDAELWIVELIRNARLHAKIDSENGNIIMGSEPEVPHKQILRKTSQLNITSQMLMRTIDKKLQPEQNTNALPSWAQKSYDR